MPVSCLRLVAVAHHELENAGAIACLHPLIAPKLGELMSVVGKPNCFWLKALKASILSREGVARAAPSFS